MLTWWIHVHKRIETIDNRDASSGSGRRTAYSGSGGREASSATVQWCVVPGSCIQLIRYRKTLARLTGWSPWQHAAPAAATVRSQLIPLSSCQAYSSPHQTGSGRNSVIIYHFQCRSHSLWVARTLRPCDCVDLRGAYMTSALASISTS